MLGHFLKSSNGTAYFMENYMKKITKWLKYDNIYKIEPILKYKPLFSVYYVVFQYILMKYKRSNFAHMPWIVLP